MSATCAEVFTVNLPIEPRNLYDAPPKFPAGLYNFNTSCWEFLVRDLKEDYLLRRSLVCGRTVGLSGVGVGVGTGIVRPEVGCHCS